MKIPATIVRGGILRIFARASQEFAISPSELVVLFCVSLAAPGEKVQFRAVELITGLLAAEVRASIASLKTAGLIEQLGEPFPLTARGREALNHVEAD